MKLAKNLKLVYEHSRYSKNKLNEFLLLLSYALKSNKSFGLPAHIAIEAVNFCNLRCIMCPHGTTGLKREQGYMSLKDFKKIIDQVESHAHTITIGLFGEPLLHKDLSEMIKYCKDKKMRVRIATNGTILDKKKAKDMLEAGLDLIIFSFDAITKSTYEKIRVGGDFKTTLKNIENFIKLKDEMNSTIKTDIQLIKMKQNEKDVEKFVEHWKKFNSKNVEVNIKKLHNWAENIKMEDIENILTERCPRLWYELNIYWNGDTVLCCKDYSGVGYIGNVFKTPIKELWNNKAIIAMRNIHLKGQKHKTELCRECTVWRSEDHLRTKI